MSNKCFPFGSPRRQVQTSSSQETSSGIVVHGRVLTRTPLVKVPSKSGILSPTCGILIEFQSLDAIRRTARLRFLDKLAELLNEFLGPGDQVSFVNFPSKFYCPKPPFFENDLVLGEQFGEEVQDSALQSAPDCMTFIVTRGWHGTPLPLFPEAPQNRPHQTTFSSVEKADNHHTDDLPRPPAVIQLSREKRIFYIKALPPWVKCGLPHRTLQADSVALLSVQNHNSLPHDEPGSKKKPRFSLEASSSRSRLPEPCQATVGVAQLGLSRYLYTDLAYLQENLYNNLLATVIDIRRGPRYSTLSGVGTVATLHVGVADMSVARSCHEALLPANTSRLSIMLVAKTARELPAITYGDLLCGRLLGFRVTEDTRHGILYLNAQTHPTLTSLFLWSFDALLHLCGGNQESQSASAGGSNVNRSAKDCAPMFSLDSVPLKWSNRPLNLKTGLEDESTRAYRLVRWAAESITQRHGFNHEYLASLSQLSEDLYSNCPFLDLLVYIFGPARGSERHRALPNPLIPSSNGTLALGGPSRFDGSPAASEPLQFFVEDGSRTLSSVDDQQYCAALLSLEDLSQATRGYIKEHFKNGIWAILRNLQFKKLSVAQQVALPPIPSLRSDLHDVLRCDVYHFDASRARFVFLSSQAADAVHRMRSIPLCSIALFRDVFPPESGQVTC